jgi:hypothetical protein
LRRRCSRRCRPCPGHHRKPNRPEVIAPAGCKFPWSGRLTPIVPVIAVVAQRQYRSSLHLRGDLLIL